MPMKTKRRPDQTPHGGRQDDHGVVSIRAPARGATYAATALFSSLDVSIRAPARGGDQFLCGSYGQRLSFLSAPPHGGRPKAAHG